MTRDLILLLSVFVFLIFGYFIMKKLDYFLNLISEDEKREEK